MRKFIALLTLAAALFFMSCTDELSLKVNKDGSVDMSLSVAAEEALTQILKSMAENAGVTSLIDKKALSKDFTDSGFSNVKVTSKGSADFSATMTDKNKKSPLFTTGFVSVDGSSVKAVITPEKLAELYNESDEQTQMVLDMLLAPVFYDEEMSEEEYIMVISSVYGADVGQEIKNSKVNIVIENSNGVKKTYKVGLPTLLTLSKPLIFQF